MISITENLSFPVYFENGQWAVTAYGLERIDGRRYEIEARLLGEARDNGYSNWLLHMAGKWNVDFPDFVTAFCMALDVHGVHCSFDLPASIRLSFMENQQMHEGLTTPAPAYDLNPLALQDRFLEESAEEGPIWRKGSPGGG